MPEITKMGDVIINFDHVVSVEPRTAEDGKKSAMMYMSNGRSLQLEGDAINEIAKHFEHTGSLMDNDLPVKLVNAADQGAALLRLQLLANNSELNQAISEFNELALSFPGTPDEFLALCETVPEIIRYDLESDPASPTGKLRVLLKPSDGFLALIATLRARNV